MFLKTKYNNISFQRIIIIRIKYKNINVENIRFRSTAPSTRHNIAYNNVYCTVYYYYNKNTYC